MNSKGKSKAIRVQAWTGPGVFRWLRLTNFQTVRKRKC